MVVEKKLSVEDVAEKREQSVENDAEKREQSVEKGNLEEKDNVNI